MTNTTIQKKRATTEEGEPSSVHEFIRPRNKCTPAIAETSKKRMIRIIRLPIEGRDLNKDPTTRCTNIITDTPGKNRRTKHSDQQRVKISR